MTEDQTEQDDAVEWAEMTLPAGLETLRKVEQETEKVSPLCPRCGHALHAAYDDCDDSWWECSACGGEFSTHTIASNRSPAEEANHG